MGRGRGGAGRVASGIGEALGVGRGACRWPGDQGASWGQCVVSMLVVVVVVVVVMMVMMMLSIRM